MCHVTRSGTCSGTRSERVFHYFIRLLLSSTVYLTVFVLNFRDPIYTHISHHCFRMCISSLPVKEKVHFENRASELASELRNKEQENENIRTELDQMMKYYDDANGQVNQMEMALEKVW